MGLLQDTADAVSEGFGGVVDSVTDGITAAQTEILNSINNATNLNASSISEIKVGSAVASFNDGNLAFSGSFKVAGQEASFDIKFDPKSGSFTGSKVKVAGQEIPLDPTKMAATAIYLIEHSVEWIPNFGAVQRIIESEYDDIKKRLENDHGQDNVYLASPQFVRWANPTTLATRVITLIASAGAASEAIIQEVKSKAEEEFGLIKKWLQAKQLVNVDFDQAVNRLLAGETPSLILPELNVRWQNIKYRSWVRIGGNDVSATKISIVHWGFAIIWKSGGINFTRVTGQDTFKNEDPDLAPVRTKWFLGVKPQYTIIGCLLILVTTGSPAANAGLKVGDTILTVDGFAVGDAGGRHNVLWRVLQESQTGKVVLSVRKEDGTIVTVDVQMVTPP